LLNVSRGHEVPEHHFRAESRGVLVVDRYSAYKAMSWVKQGFAFLPWNLGEEKKKELSDTGLNEADDTS
jgi:hypothetical protein